MRTLLILFIVFGGSISLFSAALIPSTEADHVADSVIVDSTNIYFEDLTHLLSLRLFTLTKSSTLEVISESQGRIILKPNGNTGLGLGFNYKFLGLALSFGLPKAPSSVERYGQTNSMDIQVSVFGKRIGMDAYFQGYKGYYMSNPQDHMDWEESYYPQIGDMRVLSYGANAFYMFNNKQFSYKAAYVRNVVQKKSAGSLSAGLFFYQDQVKSASGFIPEEVSDSVWSGFDLTGFNAFSIGLSVGYQYTFVIKENFFINLQATPGLGYRRLSGSAASGDLGVENQLAGHALIRLAIGYEFRHFYLGATGSTILRSFKYGAYKVDLGTELFRVMIGKRFNVSRK